MIVGLMCVIPTVIQLTAYLFDVTSTTQIAYFEAFRAYGPGKAIPLMLALALTAGVVEEITYRGFMQNTLNRKYHRWLSILLIAVIFTLMHLLPLPLVLPYMIVSVIFSLVAEKTKSTGVVIVAHALVDFVLFLLIYYEATSLTQIQPSVLIGNLVMLIVGISVLFYHLNSSKRSLLSLATS
jgi:membrane protease YdiL (CAAX protease family)